MTTIKKVDAILKKESLTIIRRLMIYQIIFIILSASACTGQNQGTATTLPQLTSASISSTSSPTQAPTATPTVIQGTISIWHSWNESEIPALVQIIADFQEQYPEVLFDVLYVPVEDLKPRFEEEARQGFGPTLLLGPASWGSSLFDAGLITEFTGMVNQELLESLNQPALGSVRHGEMIIGLPYAIDGIVLFRNRDIMTISPSNFEDLVTLSQTATQGDIVGAILERSFLYSGAHLEGTGGKLMDENGYPLFNDDHGKFWLEILKRFEGAGPTDYQSDQDIDYFKEGRIGWIIDGTWNLDDLAEAIEPEKLAIDEWPTIEGGHLSGFVRSENLYLNKNTKLDDLDSARLFIEHFISSQAQSRIAEVGRIPASTKVILNETTNGPLITQAITALEDGTTYPNTEFIDIYNVYLDIALRSVFEQGIAPESALQTAYDSIMLEISQLQATPSPTP